MYIVGMIPNIVNTVITTNITAPIYVVVFPHSQQWRHGKPREKRAGKYHDSNNIRANIDMIEC